MNWGSFFSFDKPYQSVNEASKAKRNVLLELCALIAIQIPASLLLWWANLNGTPLPSSLSPSFDGLIFLIFALIVYFTNSRIAAILLAILGAFSLVTTWVLKVSITADYSPPIMGLLLMGVVAQLAIVVFKTHIWQKVNKTKPTRSKWVLAALIGTSMGILAAYFVPIIHFWYYTNSIKLTDIGGILAYHDPLDNYGFDFSKTWVIQPVPLEYGTVELMPTYKSSSQTAKVRVERWSPSNVAAIALFDKSAFLVMAKGEASHYADENGASIEKIQLIGTSDSNINAAYALYLNKDGSKRYIYYYYDRTWSRATSKSAWFFWRVTADIPKDAPPNDEAEFQSMIRTFRINGLTVESSDKINLEEVRESFAYFIAAAQLPLPDLKNKIMTEVNELMQSNSPDKSKLLEARADVSTYTQKDSNDTQINNLEKTLVNKYGKCWGVAEGQCFN